MKTNRLFVWACLALFMSLFAIEAKAGNEENYLNIETQDTLKNSKQKEIERLRSDMQNLAKQLQQLSADLGKDSINRDPQMRAELSEALAEVAGEIRELQEEMMELEQELAEVIGDKGKDSSKSKMIEISDGMIRIGYKSDKDSIIPKKKKLPNVKTEMFNADLGVNMYMDNGSFSLSPANSQLQLNIPRSVNFSLYVVRQGLNIVKHKFYSTVALGLNYKDYRFREDITLQPNKDTLTITESTMDFSKNKLSTQYVTVPLLFHFDSNPYRPSRSFKFAVGGYGEFLLKAYTKQVSKEMGKQKFNDDYSLNNISYGVITQLGYGDLQFYYRYSFAPLFSKGKGPELYPITFGVVLNGFNWKS